MKHLKKIRTQTKPLCIICKSQGIPKYHYLKDRLFGVGGSWQISECSNKSCSHLWLDPSPINAPSEFIGVIAIARYPSAVG